jgi:hypothetical protein
MNVLLHATCTENRQCMAASIEPVATNVQILMQTNCTQIAGQIAFLAGNRTACKSFKNNNSWNNIIQPKYKPEYSLTMSL